MQNARYWLLTIPRSEYTLPDSLPTGIIYLRGQLERGDNTGYEHWQILCVYTKPVRLAAVKREFGSTCHGEPSRSEAARAYVWKDDTSLGERFELGTYPTRRNSKTDWAAVWESAKSQDLAAIPDSVRVQHYRTLRVIGADFARPVATERVSLVFWGTTGSGKSRKAWELGGLDAYCKDPRTKFWCGYQGEGTVIIDEFRGGIDISHILRWLDRYPVRVETKGASCPLRATRFIFTSNLHPSCWYPGLDQETYQALERRIRCYEFPCSEEINF